MRDYGKVFTGFWSSETTRSLSDDGRMLALYLLTSDHTNMIGTLRLPDGYACEDLQWSIERVSEGFANCLAKGFATRFDGSNLVVIHNYLTWNPVENQNQAKAAIKLLESLPYNTPQRPAMVRAVADSVAGFKKPIDDEYATKIQTLLEPFPNPFETSNSNSSSNSTSSSNSKNPTLAGENCSMGIDQSKWGGVQ